jgi:catechol 2,3-dioxygenase-like lactoylglutathione lyase family enzyme
VFERVTIRVSDLAASEAFYGTVLSALGPVGDQFALAPADRGVTQRLHIGFRARSRAEVDEFWRLGIDSGYRDDGAPGPRPQYGPDYYGGFLLDPDGNSAEAVFNEGGRGAGAIDHLWIRVVDLEAARAVCEDLSGRTGFELGWRHNDPPRVGFRGEGGSFSVVDDGEPTRNLRVEFDGGGFEVDAGRLTGL